MFCAEMPFMSTPKKRFTIALSFPGEHRPFVEQVAAALSNQIGKDHVLYDKYYEAEFARPNLDTHLQSLYHDDSELIAVFLCEDYERKEWCGLEWRAIRDLIKRRQASSVMPLRFDTIEIPGLFSTDGYVWIDNRTPLEIAALILKRLEVNANSLTDELSTAVAPANSVQSSSSSSQPITNHPTPADYNPANRVFNVPFRPKGDQVIGRDEALEQVRDQLTQGKHTAIGHTAAFEGLGGLGKTQLAVEYAYYFDDCYPNGVIWISADQDINAQLTDIAVTSRWVAPETEHKIKLDVALHRLRSFSECLIIFDNVDDYAAIKPFLPLPRALPHLLATSRTSLTGFKAIHLEQLDKEQSLQLLFQEASRQAIDDEDTEAANKIVEQLDGLPLALELAGAYLCHRSSMSFAQYRDRLISDPIKTLSNPYLASFTKHDADLFRTLKIDEDIIQEEPLLADILDILTWSGPAAMGLSLMSALLDKKELELSGALAMGTQLKLFQKNPKEERFALHRLVREVRRGERPLAGRDEWLNQVCKRLGDWFEMLREDFLELPRFEAEIDHLIAWRDNIENKAPLHACKLTWLQAYPSYHRGMYRESFSFLSKSRAIYSDAMLESPRLLANLLNDIGMIYDLLGQYSLAKDTTELALRIRIDTLGERHPDTAMSYNNAGSNYGRLGDYRSAQKHHAKSLEIYLELFGEQHQGTARSYLNLGTAYGALGEHQKALEYKEKALEIYQKLLGEIHPDTAWAYNNVAITLSFLSDHQKVLEYMEKALYIRLQLLGERHTETAESYNNVGRCYCNLGDFKKSLECYKIALKIISEVLGEVHPDTAKSYNNIGILYCNIYDYKNALDYETKALDIYREIFGDCHINSIELYCRISLCYFKLGKHSEAKQFLHRGHDFAKLALPKNHPIFIEFEKGIREIAAKTSRPGFRKLPLNLKKKKRK
jgi:tetratricopeptide (TPR) repeat protein